MFTKLISFVCVLTLALSSMSYAVAPPILVGDWQNCYDSWQVGWGGVLMGFSGTGATLNGNALNVVLANGSWGSAIQLKLQGPTGGDLNNYGAQSMIPLLFGATEKPYTGSEWDVFECDITVLAAEWLEDNDRLTDPYRAMKLVLNTGGFNAANEWAGVWYDAGDIVLPDGTTNCVWNIAAGIAQTVDVWNACYTASDQYYELMLIPQNSGYIGNVQYHIDAAYLTPEPATIALLGLGGLSLIRRKR